MVSRIGYIRLLLALFLSFLPLTARAAGGLTLGAACSNADENSAHASITSMQYVRCTGGVWTLQAIQPGAATDTCAAAKAGQIQWTGTALQYCNGSTWTPFKPSGGSPGSGYFVLTKTTYTGNMGGLAGANANCLTDLTTNTGWFGYT
jgi:hypothetical protein